MPRKGSYFEHKFGEKLKVGFSKKKAIPDGYVEKNKLGKIIAEKWLHNGGPDRKMRTRFLSDQVSKLFAIKFIQEKPLNIMVLGSGKGENLPKLRSDLLFDSLSVVAEDYIHHDIKNKEIKELLDNNKTFQNLLKVMKKKGYTFFWTKEVSDMIYKDLNLKEFSPKIAVLNLTKSNLSEEGKTYVNKDYSGKPGKETYFEDLNNPKLLGKYDYVNAVESVGKHTFFQPQMIYKSALLLKKGGVAEVEVTLPRSFSKYRNYGYDLKDYSFILEQTVKNHYRSKDEFYKFHLILNNYFELAKRKYGMEFKISVNGFSSGEGLGGMLSGTEIWHFIIKRTK